MFQKHYTEPGESMQTLAGSFYVLVLYDVAEEIDLGKLAVMIQGAPPRREPTFRHPAPDYVRFERSPVVESLPPVSLPSGEVFQCRIKYFDYGIVCVELTLDFETGWEELVRLSSRWITAPDLEKAAADLVSARVKEIDTVLNDKYETFLSEDYYVIHVNRAPDETGRPMEAVEMEARHGDADRPDDSWRIQTALKAECRRGSANATCPTTRRTS